LNLSEQEQQSIFEDEVRRIARELWPQAQYSGSRIVDGKERDGIFETEDCIHLVESTVSRSKSKAQDDSKKLLSLSRKVQSEAGGRAIKCWFVTKDEPTADQRGVIATHASQINATSFAQFQAKLINVPDYLNLREKYAFGSVRDPATGKPKIDIQYIPLDLVQNSSGKLWSVAEIKAEVLNGGNICLLGDYGAGKSMTLRELNQELRSAYFKGRTSKFPLYINLRDHIGQTNPAEVLERHARNIGFPNPGHLVRAWRAGYAILLLDGFDELTTLGINGLWKRLHESRYRAMQVVRELLRDQPSGSGVVVSGRAHFFDSDRERKSALGLNALAVELSLSEFNDGQIARYLERTGLVGAIPSWMPSRPLLVGYLVANGLLSDLLADSGGGDLRSDTDPALGWNLILDRICAREAEIEAGIDGPTVRHILERLATVARSTPNALGPLTREQVFSTFEEICGYAPDERGQMLLQRLPGLGIDRSEEGTRIFIDESLADACRAGDVVVFARDPYNTSSTMFRSAICGLGSIGIGVATHILKEENFGSGKFNAAINRASGAEDRVFLTFDLVSLTLAARCSVDTPQMFREILIPNIELGEDMGDCSKLSFVDCYFSRIEIDAEVDEARLPKFTSCYIGELEGRASISDLPKNAFDEKCVFESFAQTPTTTSSIGGMDLSLGAKVMLTILKKIYAQSGSGRKENALHRGLDHHSRRLVPSVLRLLSREQMIIASRRGSTDLTIWMPDRGKAARAARIMTAPITCGDSLILQAAELT